MKKIQGIYMIKTKIHILKTRKYFPIYLKKSYLQ